MMADQQEEGGKLRTADDAESLPGVQDLSLQRRSQ